MKKFYFFMLALFCAFGVNAQVYVNVLGGFNSWSDNGLQPTDNVTTHTLAIGTTEFKVKVWDGSKDNWYSTGGAITIGQATTITGNNNSNMTIAGATAGETFVVKTEVINGTGSNGVIITVTRPDSGGETPTPDPDPTPTDEYFIHYNISGGDTWTFNNAMTADGSNYTATFTTTAADNYVCFTKGQMTNWTGYTTRYAASEKDLAVVSGTQYDMNPAGGDNCWKVGAGTWTVVADFTNNKVTFTSEGTTPDPDPTPDPTPSNVYVNIIGTFNQWADNGLQPTDNVTVHENLAIGNGEFKVKVYNGTADVYYSTGSAVTADQATTITANADANMTIAGAAEGDVFNVTTELVNGTGNDGVIITITKVSGDTPTPDPTPTDEYFIHYNISGGNDWTFNNAMTADGSNYTATFSTTAADNYVCFTKGQMTEWAGYTTRYAASEKDLAVVSGTQYDMNPAGGDNCWKLAAGTWTVVADFTNNKVTFTSDGTTPDPDPTPDPTPTDEYFIHYNISGGNDWTFNNAMTADGSNYTATFTTTAADNYVCFTKGQMTEWAGYTARYAASEKDLAVVSGTQYDMNPAGGDNCWKVGAGTWTVVADFTNNKVTFTSDGTTPDPTPDPVTMPEKLYLIGNLSTGSWNAEGGQLEMTKDATASQFTVSATIADSGDGYGYFSFITVPGTDWDTQINTGDRYGAATSNVPVAAGETVPYVLFQAGVNASAAGSWKILAGSYNFVMDFAQGALTVTSNGDTPTPDPDPTPEGDYYIHYDLSGTAAWTFNNLMTADGSNYTATFSTSTAENYVCFTKGQMTDWAGYTTRYAASEDGLAVVSGTEYDMNPAGGDNCWKVGAGTWTVVADFTNNKVTFTSDGTTPDPDPTPITMPEKLYLIGNLSTGSWAEAGGQLEMTKDATTSQFTVSATIADAGEGYGYFSFITVPGTDWDTQINTGDRYGAATQDEAIVVGTEVAYQVYKAGVDASAAKSWKIAAGEYTFTMDFKNATLTVKDNVGVSDIELNNTELPVYYNLQGVQVENPTTGIYIERRGNNVRKVMIK